MGPARADGTPTYYYEDSFGNIVPCAADAIAAGIYPPPIWTPAPGQGEDVARGHQRPRGGRSGRRPGPRPADGADTSCGASGTTYSQPSYTQPNILLIMVDQLRAPRWLPSGGQGALARRPAPEHSLPAESLGHVPELFRGGDQLFALAGNSANGPLLATDLHVRHSGPTGVRQLPAVAPALLAGRIPDHRRRPVANDRTRRRVGEHLV